MRAMLPPEVAIPGTGHSKRGTWHSIVTNSGTISPPCHAFVCYNVPPCRPPCSELGRPLASRRCRPRPPRPAIGGVPAEPSGEPRTGSVALQDFRRSSSSVSSRSSSPRSGRTARHPSPRSPRRRPRASCRPVRLEPLIVATQGALAAAAADRAEPRHRDRLPLGGRRRAVARSAGPPRQPGPHAAAVRTHLRREPVESRLVPARRERDVGTRHRCGAGHGCVLAGRRHHRRDHELRAQRQDARRPHRHSAADRAGADRVGDAASSRSGAHGRGVGRRPARRGSEWCSTSRTSSGRPSPASRRTRETT